MSEKKQILSALHRIEFGYGKNDFRQTLSGLAERILSKNRLDADAFAHANLSKYWNWLAKEIDNHKARGITPFFSITPGHVYAFESVSQVLLSSNDSQQKKQGELAISRPAMLRQIDQMTDREFEALACITCSAIGSAKTELTPPGNEGGVDFFATLSLKGNTHVLSAAGTELRIVGQCKKYATPVAVDKIEQFITTIQNVRHRSDRVAKHIPAWFADSRGPILGWVMAHSGFQTGAADEAKNHGILLSDTLDLAELVCLSNSFYPSLNPADRAMRLLEECKKLI